MTPDLIRHVERHLGPLSGGWKASGEDGEIQVARVEDCPYQGVSTFVTLGLSRRPLPMPQARQVRQELLFFTEDDQPAEQVASFLLTFAQYVRGQHRALLRGDVVGPGPPLIPNADCNAVYASIPVLHDERLATFEGTDPATVFVWLLPLQASEAEMVRDEGWESFEDLLETRSPDFADLDRPALA